MTSLATPLGSSSIARRRLGLRGRTRRDTSQLAPSAPTTFTTDGSGQVGFDLGRGVVAVRLCESVQEVRRLDLVLLSAHRFQDERGEQAADLGGPLPGHTPVAR